MTVTTFVELRESSLASSVSTQHLHLLSISGIPKNVNIKKQQQKYKKWPCQLKTWQKIQKRKKKEKIKNKNKMCREGGSNLHYLLCLISNTLPQLEQSSLHPRQFSVIASCYLQTTCYNHLRLLLHLHSSKKEKQKQQQARNPLSLWHFSPLQKSNHSAHLQHLSNVY